MEPLYRIEERILLPAGFSQISSAHAVCVAQVNVFRVGGRFTNLSFRTFAGALHIECLGCVLCDAELVSTNRLLLQVARKQKCFQQNHI